ncbi:hypothetical protein [Ferruginibacter sp.]
MFVNKYKYKAGIAVILLPALVAAFFSCKQNKAPRTVDRSFYYWKSVFKLNDLEQKQLDALQVKTLYIKFFDVGWDPATHAAIPIAKLQSTGYKLAAGIEVIPTVFITNECIQQIDSAQVEGVAAKIVLLTEQLVAANQFATIEELQIDCDWTAGTRDKYFLLLSHIKKLKPALKLSATIRLHQVKFIAKTGVPPVDQGLLMCYNMGNLKNIATKNSIIETAELKKYIGNLAAYPLPLDVALPLFSWKVLFRNNIYTGLIQDLPDTVLNNAFTIRKDNRFEILKDTLLQGYDLKKGDLIRNEASDYKEIIAAAAAINDQLKNTRLKVSLYHLDSVILNKYSLHELEAIYNSLR